MDGSTCLPNPAVDLVILYLIASLVCLAILVEIAARAPELPWAQAKSRLAAVGDKLITKNFGTGTTGFADINAQDTAVCVLPGTEIAFEGNVRRIYVGSNERELPYSVAIFRQVEKEVKCTHHDALEFPNGQLVKLTVLEPGQHATVLQLPAAPKNEAEAENQKRIEAVG
jgi:hypothetical protein